MPHLNNPINVRLDQGSTSLLIDKERGRIVTRGAALDFNTVDDLQEFANELSILMVQLSTEIEKQQAEVREPNPQDTPET